MDTKKFLVGTVIGTVGGFIAGGLLFGMVLSNYFAENASMSPEPDMLWLALGHVAIAALLTYIFLQWASIKTAAGGAKAGALIVFLAVLGADWIYYATTDIFTGGPIVPIVDAIATSVVWAIGGAAIGWYLGRGE